MDNFNLTKWYRDLYIKESLSSQPDQITISYTYPGSRFYGAYIYRGGKDQWDEKIRDVEEFNNFLSDLNIHTEVPRRHDQEKIDSILFQLRKLGIKAQEDEMDVS